MIADLALSGGWTFRDLAGCSLAQVNLLLGAKLRRDAAEECRSIRALQSVVGATFGGAEGVTALENHVKALAKIGREPDVQETKPRRSPPWKVYHQPPPDL